MRGELAIPLIEEMMGRLNATRDKGSKLYAAKPQNRHACNRLVGLAKILGVGWHYTKTCPKAASSGV